MYYYIRFFLKIVVATVKYIDPNKKKITNNL